MRCGTLSTRNCVAVSESLRWPGCGLYPAVDCPATSCRLPLTPCSPITVCGPFSGDFPVCCGLDRAGQAPLSCQRSMQPNPNFTLTRPSFQGVAQPFCWRLQKSFSKRGAAIYYKRPDTLGQSHLDLYVRRQPSFQPFLRRSGAGRNPGNLAVGTLALPETSGFPPARE